VWELLRTGLGAKDEQALLAVAIEGHEHEGLRFRFHAPQFAATVAGDPSLAIVGDVHLGDIIPLIDIIDCDAAPTLREKPIDEFLATLAFFHISCQERYVTHVLKDTS